MQRFEGNGDASVRGVGKLVVGARFKDGSDVGNVVTGSSVAASGCLESRTWNGKAGVTRMEGRTGRVDWEGGLEGDAAARAWEGDNLSLLLG